MSRMLTPQQIAAIARGNGPQILDPRDLQQLSQMEGLSGLGDQTVGNDDRRFKIYTASFDAAIAAGSGNSSSKFVDLQFASDTDFVCEDMRGDFRLSAASGAMVAGTPLPRESSITLASNTSLGSLGLVLLQFSLQQLEWCSEPVPANLVLGDARAPGYFLTLPRVIAGDRLRITAFNNTAETGAGVSLLGKILLCGYTIRRNPVTR